MIDQLNKYFPEVPASEIWNALDRYTDTDLRNKEFQDFVFCITHSIYRDNRPWAIIQAVKTYGFTAVGGVLLKYQLKAKPSDFIALNNLRLGQLYRQLYLWKIEIDENEHKRQEADNPDNKRYYAYKVKWATEDAERTKNRIDWIEHFNRVLEAAHQD